MTLDLYKRLEQNDPLSALQFDTNMADIETEVNAATTILSTHTTQISSLNSSLALKAPLSSPVFTGVPTAPTAAPGTNTSQLATTAFVLANSSTGDGVQKARLLASNDYTGNVTLVGGAPNEIDGFTLIVADVILVVDQNDPIENGLYSVQTVGTGSNGTWVRLTGITYDTGMLIAVKQGQHAASTWMLSTISPVVNTTPLRFVRQSIWYDGGNLNVKLVTGLQSITTGFQNVSLGYDCLFSVTSGFANVAGGYNSLGDLTTGFSNTAFGNGAGATTSNGNVPQLTASNCSFFGANSGATSSSAVNRTSLGFEAAASIDNAVFLGNGSVTNIYMGDTTKRVDIVSKLALTISSGTLSTNASIHSYFTVAMNANITTFANPTGLSDGQKLRWRLVQDATGGRTWTGFGSMFKWPGGIVPTLSTGANQVDLLEADYDLASNTLMARLNKNFA